MSTNIVNNIKNKIEEDKQKGYEVDHVLIRDDVLDIMIAQNELIATSDDDRTKFNFEGWITNTIPVIRDTSIDPEYILVYSPSEGFN